MLDYFIFTFWCKIFLFCFFDSIPSSKACGPFSSFNTSWEVIPDTVLQFPTGLQHILFGMASQAFAVPFFVILWWVLWRLDSLMQFYFLAYWTHTKHLLDHIFHLQSKASKPIWILTPYVFANVFTPISFVPFPLAHPIFKCPSQKMLTLNPLQISTVSPVITIRIHNF